ncbi:uncharacterized protein LOC124144807 isoform X2 [Haliotis rufescens]|uniref:uncharacterized protein LOC124144807 isoform X2 n=1 Tax=Haliotis rufescens TaxID=6454 RepID=UPI00201EA3DF|nr:uncharacterized protein LOC124144807 isoform X2 [Haliotis rufescens]
MSTPEADPIATNHDRRVKWKPQFVKLPKKRDVYESFMLKGLVPEMSYFTIIALVYSAAKMALGAVYYNDCSLEPRLFVYLLVSSSLLLLYLPIIANLGQKALGLKVYIRLITFLQLVGLCFGSYLLYNVHIGRQNNQLQDVTSKVTPKVTCNDVIFKFTAATIGVEWTYIFVSFLARGFVTVLFHLVVVLLKTVFKMLFSMMRHDKKEKTS